jgi:hypothetical protein
MFPETRSSQRNIRDAWRLFDIGSQQVLGWLEIRRKRRSALRLGTVALKNHTPRPRFAGKETLT